MTSYAYLKAQRTIPQGRSMPMYWLLGDVDWVGANGWWISRRLFSDTGGFHYWVVIGVYNMERRAEDWCTSKHWAYVGAVAPGALDPDSFSRSVLQLVGEGHTGDTLRAELLMELVVNGDVATVWDGVGDSAHRLRREAGKVATEFARCPDVFLDRPVNAVGNTGWDLLSGFVGQKSGRRDPEVVKRQDGWMVGSPELTD